MKKRLMRILLSMMVMLPLAVPAFAADRIQDVDYDSPWYEGIIYAYEHGITAGTGNNCFSPDSQISVREWAVMLCRALNLNVEPAENGAFAEAELHSGYSAGWLNLSEVLHPDTYICRASFYESALQAFDVPIYSFELYPNGSEMSTAENYVRVAKEFGLCGFEATAADIITRGEAAQLIFLLQTQDYVVDMPPIVSLLNVINADQVDLNAYLLEANKIPMSILQEFQERGWKYAIDCVYLRELSEKLNMTCIGAASYAHKTIYVSEASATVHEFGHFLDYTLGFPTEHQELYEAESEAAARLIREYTKTNSHEFFADCFAYWIRNKGDLERFKMELPDTAAYFERLETGLWCE